MRRIDRTCLATMQSPVRHLMANHLPNSIFSIAPERQAEFDTALNDFDLTFVPERRWKFCADPATREIFVSRGAVDLLWCASLAHFLFYTQMIQGRRFDRPAEIDPQSNPRVYNALLLLRSAIKCQLKGDQSEDWPPNLPRPLQNPPHESDENVADELCLVSAAYLLHHEMAHIRLRHSAGVADELSLSQEKEADIAAAEWVLDGVAVESPMFVKRILGCVQGFLLATVMGLYGGNLGGETHPFSYDRLASLLHRFLGEQEHIAEGFAFAVLDLHFQNSGRQLTTQAFNSPKDALEAICNQLAEEQARRAAAGHQS